MASTLLSKRISALTILFALLVADYVFIAVKASSGSRIGEEDLVISDPEVGEKMDIMMKRMSWKRIRACVCRALLWHQHLHCCDTCYNVYPPSEPSPASPHSS